MRQMHEQHRFRTPLDYRYRLYPLPSVADVRCPKCRSRCKFSITPRGTFAKDEQSGGYRLRPLPIETSVFGKGACTRCGYRFSFIQWPKTHTCSRGSRRSSLGMERDIPKCPESSSCRRSSARTAARAVERVFALLSRKAAKTSCCET
jgi:hypothetical protein